MNVSDCTEVRNQLHARMPLLASRALPCLCLLKGSLLCPSNDVCALAVIMDPVDGHCWLASNSYCWGVVSV